MNPREYEIKVAQHFANEGFEVELTTYQGDYGVDVLAKRGSEKLAIQAKMFGGTSRKVNRSMVMELYGAAAYFGCTSAVIATDGDVLPDALEVAKRLMIAIVHISASGSVSPEPIVERRADSPPQSATFESIWEKHVMPLAGSTIRREDGTSNQILKVDWSGVLRITSNGKRQLIKIEIFKQTIDHLLKHGAITRSQINDDYKERASSGVVLILSNVPGFELTKSPVGLRLVSFSLS